MGRLALSGSLSVRRFTLFESLGVGRLTLVGLVAVGWFTHLRLATVRCSDRRAGAFCFRSDWGCEEENRKDENMEAQHDGC